MAAPAAGAYACTRTRLELDPASRMLCTWQLQQQAVARKRSRVEDTAVFAAHFGGARLVAHAGSACAAVSSAVHSAAKESSPHSVAS